MPYNLLSPNAQELLLSAERALTTAYIPYSGFAVGAALRAASGEIITGSNVENAAYGSTICAERAAILHANARDLRIFQAIALIGKPEAGESTKVTAPCGACRQMLYESADLAGKNLEVVLSDSKKEQIIVTSILELLPLPFGPSDLGIDLSKYRA